MNAPLPLRAPQEIPKRPPPTLAPPWVALLTAWLGILMLLASIIFVFLPGTRNPRAELEHQTPYSVADRFLPVPIYGIAVVLFLGIVVIWQMRKEARPLADGLRMQRTQAWTGIALALVSAIVIYVHVAFHGPR